MQLLTILELNASHPMSINEVERGLSSGEGMNRNIHQ
jgi:hypothetical protein